MSTKAIPSFCRVCHHACPIIVDLDSGVAQQVRGDPANDVYQGYTCVKGRAQPSTLRHPQRLLRSMKRNRNGVFEPVHVEDALDEIAARLRRILNEHGPRAVASYFGTMAAMNSTVSSLMYAFMKGLGSPMCFTPNTLDKPGKSIARALHGGFMAPPQGFDDPEVALLIGINPVVSYQGAPFGNPAKWFAQRLRDGMQLVVIDPRRSDVARRASLHIQPRPGFDAHLLAAMLRVILDEGWEDRNFLAAHTVGLADLRNHLNRFTPSAVAAAAGVEADDIVNAARMFARADRGYVIAGTGPAMSGPGTLVEYLVLNLMSACGRWLRAGERVRNVPSLLPAIPWKAQAGPPRPAFGFGESLRVRGLTDTAAGLPTAGAAEEMLLDGPGQVRALLSCGGNPVAAWPDRDLTVRALSGLELLVQIDPFMSETAKLAHYVIAPTMPLERADVTVLHDIPLAPHVGPVDSWAQYTPPVVDRPPDSELIEDWEFYFGLARRLDVDLHIDTQILFPIPAFDLPTDVTPSTEDLLALLTRHARVALDHVRCEPRGVSIPDEGAVVAPADASCTARQQLADEHMMRDLDALRLDTEGAGAPSFRLVCRRTPSAYNSSYINEATHRGRLYNPAFMHPADLEAAGIAPGDVIRISSDTATVLAIAEEDDNLRRGLVSMSFGYGARGSDTIRDVRASGTNVNVLLRVDGTYDRYSGQPRMSNVPVTIAAAREAVPERTRTAPTD